MIFFLLKQKGCYRYPLSYFLRSGSVFLSYFLTVLCIFVFLNIIFSTKLFAQDEDVPKYLIPVIGPNVNLNAGYNFVDLKGSSRAEEYEYLHYSPNLGGEGIYFYFPHRLNIDLELKNRRDYYNDMSYSYKDLIFFRSVSRSIFHNIDNIMPVAFNVMTGALSTDIRDTGEVYGIRSGIHSLFLRLKAPDYPFHIYIDNRILDKEGIRQETGLLGSGYFNDLLVSSRKREIDWRYNEITVGTNSHLGPVEIDLSHGESRFNVKGDNVYFDFYSPSGYGPSLLRESGIYPHSLIPEIKGFSNTVKFHTSYTGSIVASATLTKKEKENKESGAQAYYLVGSGEVMWMPMPRLTFYVKYRHREKDMDVPSTVTISDISNPTKSYTYILKDAISSKSVTLSGIIRYRPIKELNIRAEYTFEDLRRDFATLWGLPSSTKRGNISISADMRVHRTVNIKTCYSHKETDKPAYNYEPDSADEARFSLTWVPFQRINTFISYSLSRENRKDLYFTDNLSTGERDVKKDRIMGNLTFLILSNLSLTVSYSYIHNRTAQDITTLIGTYPFNLLRDSMVPYKDLARNYGIDINYEPKTDITVSGGIIHTISRGIFYTSLQEISNIPGLSELKARETVYFFNGEYRLKDSIGLGLKYRYTALKDVINNPNDDINNGRAQIILLTLTRKWK